jgi:type II secretory pathway pseudopilin PulG
MAPPADAVVRRASSRPNTSPEHGSRRPHLRLFEPAPRRRSGTRAVRRSAMWASGLLIVGSLLAVVVGDSLVAQGQVRLSDAQQALAVAATTQKALQTDVAWKASPPVVVSQAESEGLVAATQVVNLPEVSLRVPLPPPVLVPGTVPSSSGASTSPAGSTSNANPAAVPSPKPTTSSSNTASTTAATR